VKSRACLATRFGRVRLTVRFGGVLLAAMAAGPFVATSASAHPRATSLSSWELERGVDGLEARVTVRVPWGALQGVLPELAGLVPEPSGLAPGGVGRGGGAGAAIDGYLLEHVRVATDAGPCRLRGSLHPVMSTDTTHLGRHFRVACGAGDPRISVDLFHEVDASHLHLARARLPDGSELDRVMVVGQETWRPLAVGEDGAPASTASSLGDYLWLGVEHIATGYDHLVFVLALLLTGHGVAQLARVVTGFTVAHSVTLALGVLGWVRPLPEAVEALIGFSIVVVACENFALTLGPAARRALRVGLGALVVAGVFGAGLGAVALPASALLGIGIFSLAYLGLSERSGRPDALRWGVALAFGLIHGFGFAGVLAETGLPPANVAPALLGFNLGVEVGQLAVVAVGWIVLRSLLTGEPARRLATIQWGSTPVLAAGLYWFLSRAWGG